MCITTKRSILSSTRIYAGEAEHNGKYVHVLAYKNSAKSLEDKPNSMVLPFPTNVPMTSENLIDTTNFKDFLQDITNASKITNDHDGLTKSAIRCSKSLSVQVFDSGSYTVVLAHDVSKIKEALQLVPENKRPDISSEFLEGFGKLYPDQPIAVCCWSGTIEPEPLLFWYEPSDKNNIFIPTMDAHDGNAPVLHEKVKVDHIISFGSTTQDFNGKHVNYGANTLKSKYVSLLPKKVHGVRIFGNYTNGDMFVNSDDSKVLSKYDQCPMLVRIPAVYNDKVNESKYRVNTFKMSGWKDSFDFFDDFKIGN